MFFRDSKQKHYEPVCNAKWDFGKISASEDQIREHCHKMRLLTHPDAGGDEEFFKTINQGYQILTNDTARELYNIFDEAKKLWITKTDNQTLYLQLQTFRIVRRSHNEIWEWKYCLISSEWCTLFLLRGLQWECPKYIKKCTKKPWV